MKTAVINFFLSATAIVFMSLLIQWIGDAFANDQAQAELAIPKRPITKPETSTQQASPVIVTLPKKAPPPQGFHGTIETQIVSSKLHEDPECYLMGFVRYGKYRPHKNDRAKRWKDRVFNHSETYDQEPRIGDTITTRLAVPLYSAPRSRYGSDMLQLDIGSEYEVIDIHRNGWRDRVIWVQIKHPLTLKEAIALSTKVPQANLEIPDLPTEEPTLLARTPRTSVPVTKQRTVSNRPMPKSTPTSKASSTSQTQPQRTVRRSEPQPTPTQTRTATSSARRTVSTRPSQERSATQRTRVERESTTRQRTTRTRSASQRSSSETPSRETTRRRTEASQNQRN